MKHSLISTFVALLAIAAASLAQASAEIGKSAPEFSLTDSKGAMHKLSEFKGRVVVLEWINLSCPYVKGHYKNRNMQNLQASAVERGVVWLTIASSAKGSSSYMDAAAWNDSIAQHGIASTAVLLDVDGTVGRLYAAKVTPHMYVIAADGTLAYNGAIDTADSADPEKIAKARNCVTEALDALLAGNKVPTAATRPYGCGIKYE